MHTLCVNCGADLLKTSSLRLFGHKLQSCYPGVALGPGYALAHSHRKRRKLWPTFMNYTEILPCWEGLPFTQVLQSKCSTSCFTPFPFVHLQADLRLLQTLWHTGIHLILQKTVKPSQMFSKWGFLAHFPWGNKIFRVLYMCLITLIVCSPPRPHSPQLLRWWLL